MQNSPLHRYIFSIFDPTPPWLWNCLQSLTYTNHKNNWNWNDTSIVSIEKVHWACSSIIFFNISSNIFIKYFHQTFSSSIFIKHFHIALSYSILSSIFIKHFHPAFSLAFFIKHLYQVFSFGIFIKHFHFAFASHIFIEPFHQACPSSIMVWTECVRTNVVHVVATKLGIILSFSFYVIFFQKGVACLSK